MIKQKVFSWWFWIAIFPPIILLILIGLFSVNVPWFDDFDPFIDFPYKWISTNSWVERIGLLFAPNNEHRMVFGKGLAILYYYLTGTVNFTYLHVVGFVFTLGTAFIFFKVFRQNSLSAKEYAPVSFFLFQWQYHLVFLWAICGLQHQPVVFFIALTMYFLAQTDIRFLPAIVSAFCANFSMSNGVLVWVGGAAILIYRREFLKLSIWLVCGAVAIFLYFKGMVTMGNEASIAYLAAHPEESFFGFFAFLGGLFDFVPDQTIQFRSRLPIIGGMFLFGLVLVWQWQVWKNYFTNKRSKPIGNSLNLFLLGVFVFVAANATIIALLRPRFGFMVMLVSNYKLYPALYMSIVYGAMMQITAGQWRKIANYAGLIVSIGIWFFTTLQYGSAIAERRKDYKAYTYNQRHNGFGLGFEAYSPAAKKIEELLNKVAEKGMYKLPVDCEQYDSTIKNTNAIYPTTAEVNLTKEVLHINIPNHEPTYGYNEGLYVFLRSTNQTYIWQIKQDIYNTYNIFRRYRKEHSVDIPRNTILPNTYDVGLLHIVDNKPYVGIINKIAIRKL